MENFNLETMLKSNMRVLALTGVLPPRQGSTYKRLFPAYAFLVRYLNLSLFYIPYFMGTWIFYEDILGLMYNGQVNVHYVVASFKCFLLWKGRHLIEELFQMATEDLFQGKTVEQKEVLRSRFRFWSVMYTYYTPSVVVTIIWLLTNPILTGTTNMAIPTWYPFDTKNLLYGTLCFVQQVVAIFVCGVSSCSYDTFMGALLVYMSCQLTMLKMSLGAFETAAGEDAEQRLSRLIMAIKHHQKIILFYNKSQDLFALSTLMQLLANIFTFTACMYALHEISVQNPTYVQALLHFSAILWQLYLYCCLGQLLSTESVELTETLMGIPWYNESIAFRKLFLILLHRSQNPIEMKAGGFVSLSHETFAQVIKTSYTYLTVLINVVD